MRIDDTIIPVATTGRAPVVLQVLPSLVSGGAERGTVELAARQDDAIPDGVVFIPFAFVEAAANLLTNPALDPFGKIPEFKFCAAQVEPLKAMAEAAE